MVDYWGASGHIDLINLANNQEQQLELFLNPEKKK